MAKGSLNVLQGLDTRLVIYPQSLFQVLQLMVFLLSLMQEADLVTTHELGHNFGAEHDPDDIADCAPREDQGGKFVMYPIAVSGDHVNNKVWSRTRTQTWRILKVPMHVVF